MQMVIMTFRSSLEGEVFKWLETTSLSYTLVEKAHGKGITGHAPGSLFRGGGGSNTLLFVGTPDEQVNDFRDRVQEFHRTLSGKETVPVPFHAFVLPCMQWC
jgi:hypothetical protein